MENDDGTISVPAQPVYLIDPSLEPIPIGQKAMVSTRPGGIFTQSDFTFTIGLAGGNQILVVPVGKIAVLESLCSDVVNTATVGNRTHGVRVMNAALVAWVGATAAISTAAQTCGYDVAFGAVGTPNTTVRRNLANTGNTNIQVREYCPIKTLVAGDSVIVDDYADIDVNDALTWRIGYTLYDA